MASLLRRGLWGAAILVALLAGTIADNRFHAEVEIVKKVPTTHKVVALTIDDGPHYKTTPELLAVLRKKQVQATLFVLGENAARNPEMITQAVADGHEIANHAYSHKDLTKMTAAQCGEELDKTDQIIARITAKPTLFRPPGGLYNETVLAEARKRGYTTVLWSLDPHDWQRPSVDQVVTTVVQHIAPGSIVLLHDGQYPLPTAAALDILIDQLRSAGYEFVTLSQLLQYYEVRGTGGGRS
jgi:peptidoglycan/xylan/chitin deacetylase (PgdA/CDA1 family)